MSAVGRNVPPSPISLGGNDWSPSKYSTRDDGRPYPYNRGNLASPPDSGGLNGNMSLNGYAPGLRNNGGPSPPPSVGRSSLFSGGSDGGRNGNRADPDESVLFEHYNALKAYLNSRGNEARSQPNKARDKLLRLSSVQFFELSTDVFDELIRRQSMARAPPSASSGPPQYLLPEKNFHPKRNQARQRLSSLGPPRFRDLGADVYHELERRFPHFVGRDIPRNGSSMSMRSGPMSRNGTPANGMFPPRGQSRVRRPSEDISNRGGGPPPPPPPDVFATPPSPTLQNGDFGRPMPKQLDQSNTIVPNKSTMLEEDDDAAVTPEVDPKLVEDYQNQIQELQDRLADMEDEMRKREDEMGNILDSERSRATATNLEKQEWSDLRLDLENKLAEAENLNATMKQELNRLRSEQTTQAPKRVDNDVQRENDQLRQSLREQERVTEEVRREAQDFLREMRTLSKQSAATYDKQLELERTIDDLEREVRDWRSRYARSKTQQGGRSSIQGISLDYDAAGYIRDKGFIDDRGLVKDVHVTKFQISIDELLQVARRDAPEKVVDSMKRVVVSVRRITRDLDESGPKDGEGAQQQSKLRARVSSTANGLITASKNFAAAAGLSPIAVLDAAASNLSAAIVDLLRAVKIRPTPAGDLDDDDDGTVTPVESTGFFSPRSTAQTSTKDGPGPPRPFQGLGGGSGRASAESSAYSPANSPRESAADAYFGRGMNGTTNRGGMIGLDKSSDGYFGNGRPNDLKVNPYGGYGGM